MVEVSIHDINDILNPAEDKCGTKSFLSSLSCRMDEVVENMDDVFINDSSGTMENISASDDVHLEETQRHHVKKHVDKEDLMGSNESTVLYTSSSGSTFFDDADTNQQIKEETTSTETTGPNLDDLIILLQEQTDEMRYDSIEEREPRWDSCQRSEGPSPDEETTTTYTDVGSSEDREEHLIDEQRDLETISYQRQVDVKEKVNHFVENNTSVWDEKDNNSYSSSKVSSSSPRHKQERKFNIHPTTIVAGQRLYRQAIERFQRLALIADSDKGKREVSQSPYRSRSCSRSGSLETNRQNNGSGKPRYLHLYEQHEKRQARRNILPPTPTGKSKSSSFTRRSQSVAKTRQPPGEKDRFNRLYDLSLKQQVEGRKRREKIQEASTKAKEIPVHSFDKISLKDADRLYYEGIKQIIHLDERRIVAAEQLEIKCHPHRFRDELKMKAKQSTPQSLFSSQKH